MATTIVTLECNGCGAEFQADKTRGAGPCYAFDVRDVFLRAYLGQDVVGAVRLDRAAADMGGPLAERLAACRAQDQARGRCLGCCAGDAVRALNEAQIDLGRNSCADRSARMAVRS